jgi:hypothetical protein
MMKVVMFQAITKVAMAQPIRNIPGKLISPMYSGARNKVEAPKCDAKCPVMVRVRMSQNSKRAWYFRKCSSTSCTGKKRYIPFSRSSIRSF